MASRTIRDIEADIHDLKREYNFYLCLFEETITLIQSLRSVPNLSSEEIRKFHSDEAEMRTLISGWQRDVLPLIEELETELNKP